MRPKNSDPLLIFIEGWGRMGSSWGIGKVMARIHALLYLSTRPLSLEEMSELLKTSRSNISLNVRALQDLGVVKKVIIPGDRRDYYAAEESIQKVARGLALAKKKREIDPALDILNKAIAAAEALEPGTPAGCDRVQIDPNRLGTLKRVMHVVEELFESFIERESVIPDGGTSLETQRL